MVYFLDYLNKYRDLNVKVTMSDYYSSGSSSDKLLPSGYGKIPDRKEYYNLVIDYQLKHEMRIVIDKNELDGNDMKKELRAYLVNLAYYIIDYYDGLEDYQIYCEYYGEDDFFKGNMYINKDNIILDLRTLEETIEREY